VKDTWKTKNPSNKATEEKFGKTYHWCKHHNQGKGMWVLHKLEDCKNRQNDMASGNQEATPPSTPAGLAHQALVEENDEDSDSDVE